MPEQRKTITQKYSETLNYSKMKFVKSKLIVFNALILSLCWLNTVSADTTDTTESLFDSCYKIDEGEPTPAVLTCYKNVIIKEPTHEWAHNNLGYLLALKGDTEGALTHLTKAIESNSKNATAYVNRADILYDSLKLDKAYEDYIIAYQLDPKETRALYRLAEIHQDKSENDAAIKKYTEYLTVVPNDSGALSNRGLVFYQLDKLDAAITDFNTILRTQPTYWPALLNRSLVHEQRKQYPKALEDINAVLSEKDSPKGAQIQALKQSARIKNLMGDDIAAITDVDRALTLSPEHSELLTLKKKIISAQSPDEAKKLEKKLNEMKSRPDFKKKQHSERNFDSNDM